MTDIKIEHGIPYHVRQYKGRYPFADMQPGDSFTVPFTAEHLNLRSHASIYGRRTNKVFKVSKIDDTWRVWRVS
jgi:hypothetical protein